MTSPMDNRAQTLIPYSPASITNLANATPAGYAVPEGTVYLPAVTGVTVAPRDFLALDETMGVRPWNGVWGASLSNNNTAGAASLISPAVITPVGTSFYSATNTVGQAVFAPLSNGYVARIYQGNGSFDADTDLNLTIYSPLGAAAYPQVKV